MHEPQEGQADNEPGAAEMLGMDDLSVTVSRVSPLRWRFASGFGECLADRRQNLGGAEVVVAPVGDALQAFQLLRLEVLRDGLFAGLVFRRRVQLGSFLTS